MNTFGTRTTLQVGAGPVQIYSLKILEAAGFPEVARLPFSLKILLENLLRTEDGLNVTNADIAALAQWDAKAERFTGEFAKIANPLLKREYRAPFVVPSLSDMT